MCKGTTKVKLKDKTLWNLELDWTVVVEDGDKGAGGAAVSTYLIGLICKIKKN